MWKRGKRRGSTFFLLTMVYTHTPFRSFSLSLPLSACWDATRPRCYPRTAPCVVAPTRCFSLASRKVPTKKATLPCIYRCCDPLARRRTGDSGDLPGQWYPHATGQLCQFMSPVPNSIPHRANWNAQQSSGVLQKWIKNKATTLSRLWTFIQYKTSYYSGEFYTFHGDKIRCFPENLDK